MTDPKKLADEAVLEARRLRALRQNRLDEGRTAEEVDRLMMEHEPACLERSAGCGLGMPLDEHPCTCGEGHTGG